MHHHHFSQEGNSQDGYNYDLTMMFCARGHKVWMQKSSRTACLGAALSYSITKKKLG